MPRAPSYPSLLLILLTGCGQAEQDPSGDLQELGVSARILGGLVRAGQVCRVPVSVAALDRAARIEAAAIALHEGRGGVAARDAFLRSMAPPGFDPRQHGHDRAAWCAGKRLEIERVDGFLAGPSGSGLLRRAEAARSGFR